MKRFSERKVFELHYAAGEKRYGKKRWGKANHGWFVSDDGYSSKVYVTRKGQECEVFTTDYYGFHSARPY